MRIFRLLNSFIAAIFTTLLFSQVGFAGPILVNSVEGPPQGNLCRAHGEIHAATCEAKVGRGGIPVSGLTDFVEDWDSLGESNLYTAVHELFHAIGFSGRFDNFAQKLIATPGSGSNGIPLHSWSYSTNGKASGIKLVVAPYGDDPSANGARDQIHADANATGTGPWPETGYNQRNDIMSSIYVEKNQEISSNDIDVLDDAYHYKTSGIKINVINLKNSLDQADMDIINQAVDVTTGLFGGSKDNSPVITWTVAEVPEPTSVALLVAGLTALWGAGRHRKSVG